MRLFLRDDLADIDVRVEVHHDGVLAAFHAQLHIFGIGQGVHTLGDVAQVPDAAAIGFGSDVAAALRELYPDDRATGYALGDFRGIAWAEVSRGS